MRVIDIPQAVQARWLDQDGGAIKVISKELSFLQWISLAVDNYKPLGKGNKASYQINRIFAAIDKANGTLVLEPDDFKIVQEAAESADWIPAVNRHALPYWQALEHAQDVKA